jgi:uncharacterized membrane protein
VSTGNLQILAEGVFAIVVTLLLFEIRVPEVIDLRHTDSSCCE